MRRLILAVALVACAAASVAGYAAWRRERAHAQLLADGEAAAATGDVRGAIEAFSGAIAVNPDSMVAWLRRGECYRALDDLNSALRDLRQAVRLDPTSPRAQEQLGDVHFAQQWYSRAAERYEAALAVDERAARVFYKLGLARFRDGQFDQAAETLRRAVAVEDNRAEAHYLLGLSMVQLNRKTEALEALARAIELDESQLPAREALAGVYLDLGRHADALRELGVLAKQDPERPERFAALALGLARAGRSNDAVLTLARAEARFPDHPVLLVSVGQVWLDDGEARGDRVALMKAVEALQQAVERGAPAGTAQSLLGRALLRLGESRRALRALQIGTASLPVPPEAFDWLGEAAEAQGRFLLARDALVRAWALTGDAEPAPRRARRAAQVAGLSLRLGFARDAVSWLERAVALQPQEAGYRLRLAEAQRRVGARPS